MSLDGLRAWVGLVERKLTMRTRVFLVLVAIAIGGAAAGVVLAIDAQDNAVSKDDLQAVRDELAGTGGPAETSPAAELEAEVETLKAEVASLRAEDEAKDKGGASSQESAGGGVGSAPESGGADVPEGRQELKEAAEEAIEKAGEGK